MSKSVDSKLPRRSFLTGAASLVGATVMGLPSLAKADGLGGRGVVKKTPMSLAYWDGSRFIPAEKLPSGDAALTSVKVAVRGYGSGSALRAIDVSSWAVTSSGDAWVPFQAWQTPPQGCGASKFTMPVDDLKGLKITTIERSGAINLPTDITLVVGTGAGPKMREGRYVLAAGWVTWDSYLLDPAAPNGPVVPLMGAAPLAQYVVIDFVRE